MSCLDGGLASKAVELAGLFLLPEITGVRFQSVEASQLKVSFARQRDWVEMRGRIGLSFFKDTVDF